MSEGSLQDNLTHTPQPLKFGTSGRRGEIIHLTQLEIYINVCAEIQYLQSLSRAEGGIVSGEDFYYAYDLRPSSIMYVNDGFGGLAQSVERAVKDQGMNPVNLGAIPTPALAFWALRHGKGSIMVTGSHIPFDRNGYKLNTSIGELMKENEKPINDQVAIVRNQLLSQAYSASLFNQSGAFKHKPIELLPINDAGRKAYIQRYLSFFAGQSLKGFSLLAYQHSAVGRDLLVEVFEALGAEVTAAGRSDSFVPIDTEAIDEDQLKTVGHLINKTGKVFDAVISTDGDSDRPLVLASNGTSLQFFGGDLLGMITAEFLASDAVVVPISTNDGIDRGSLASMLEPKTKIGSPYVIQGMRRAIAKDRMAVCGWEANGGFLTGSNIHINGNLLTALPTRDALLPILCVLLAAQKADRTLPELFASLPARFSCASLLRNFPRATSLKIMAQFSVPGEDIQEATFESGRISAFDSRQCAVNMSKELEQRLTQIKLNAQSILSVNDGFTDIAKIIYTDGCRILFQSGDVAHFRPSGNADEFRIYAVSDTQERADLIVSKGVAEPEGILRSLEKMVQKP